MRTDRVLHRPVPPRPPGTLGRPRRHSDEFAFGDPVGHDDPPPIIEGTVIRL
jgi:hypothetical protein